MTINATFERVSRFGRGMRTYGLPMSIMLLLSIAIGGCGVLRINPSTSSLGETTSTYTYIPIDPSKVQIDPGKCRITYSQILAKEKELLDMLPDNAVRMSMELSDLKGNVTYGVSKVGAAGTAYRLTADYVNSDTVSKTVWIRRTMEVYEGSFQYGTIGIETHREEKQDRKPVAIREGVSGPSRSTGSVKKIQLIQGTELYEVKTIVGRPSEPERKKLEEDKYEEFNVPIYVGIGLRIVAEGVSVSADANISGIGVIGVEAEAKRLVGSLTVQTLGVNSQAVASALPVQSELSRTTAENAFVAIGSIKSMLHQPETIKLPRVVGLLLPFPGGKPLVNALISELSRDPVVWCPSGYAAEEGEKVEQLRHGG